jgi:thioredoxin reductase (NADPH)
MKRECVKTFVDGSIVHVLVRRDQLRASKVMGDRLLSHPKVKVHFNTSPVECLGDGKLLNAVATKNTKTGELSKIEASGLFYAIGHDPANTLVKGQVDTDEDGYIITVPGSSFTSVPGIFAAGDVQDKRYRQAITSAGSGCMAALDAERYLSERESDAVGKL